MEITVAKIKRYASELSLALDDDECESICVHLTRQLDGFSILNGVNADSASPVFEPVAGCVYRVERGDK